MSHLNSNNSKFIKSGLFVLLLITNISFASPALASIKIPKCSQIIKWAATAVPEDRRIQRQYFYAGKYLLTALKDDWLKPVFGKTFGQWTDADIKQIGKISMNCFKNSRSVIREAQKKRNYTFINNYQETYRYIDAYFNAGRNTYLPLMASQRKNYKKYTQARALVKKQRAQADKMQPSSANIKKLASMPKEPLFAYLSPIDMQNHSATLRGYGVQMADKIIEKANKKFKSFPATTNGIRKLQAYRTQLQKDLGNTRSNKWSLFNKAYNTTAKQAINDFEKELNALPATNPNLQTVRNAVRNLFKYKTSPAIIKSYQEIANNRAKTMRQDLKKVACYKKLDSVGLEKKARNEPLLGYNGETTLGLFVCTMGKSGIKFQDYNSAGFFGSTYTLNVLTRRGISLSIDMKKVEAVKGKDMLVGVLVKDATSETKLSLTGWQDYTAKLLLRRR